MTTWRHCNEGCQLRPSQRSPRRMSWWTINKQPFYNFTVLEESGGEGLIAKYCFVGSHWTNNIANLGSASASPLARRRGVGCSRCFGASSDSSSVAAVVIFLVSSLLADLESYGGGEPVGSLTCWRQKKSDTPMLPGSIINYLSLPKEIATCQPAMRWTLFEHDVEF